MFKGYLNLTINPENEGRVREELKGLQITGVNVLVREDSLNTIYLVAETLDQLIEAPIAVLQIIGVWQALLYLEKETLASLLHPGMREWTIGA